DTIVIRHSIPLTNTPSGDNPPSLISSDLQSTGECYLLRSGRDWSFACEPFPALCSGYLAYPPSSRNRL
ncbi:hypothetical protein, partial [Photorhabdus stackebrandtii]|uniref:hypothetical protein n=1 Tax=Photorhabdus stackebrandtii TaxID=1123042 RepID=UPI003BB70BB6